MFNFKFSQLGALALNHLTAVPTVAVRRSPSSNALQHQNFISPIFCTQAQNHKGIEDQQRTTHRIYRPPRQKIVIVKFPVGMPLLQAAQENKIDVEGDVEESRYHTSGRQLGKDEYIVISDNPSLNGKIIHVPGVRKWARLVISPDYCFDYDGFNMVIPGCEKRVLL